MNNSKFSNIITNINHFNTKDEILSFLEKNPLWLSGFVCGEGCFTGYLSWDVKSLWGLQPGLDFNITQSTDDKLLLEAVNLYFKKGGGVYDKPNNVSVIAIRNVKVLKETIAPFFIKYPLIGKKSYELERWIKLIDIYYNKKHVGKNDISKIYMLEFAEIVKELNIRRYNSRKLIRINIIINWLKSLDNFPTKEEKLNLKNMINNFDE